MKKQEPSKNNHLQETLATLNLAMAKLTERQIDSDQRWLELRREMDQIIAILHSHTAAIQTMNQAIQNLPEAIQKKIGFKSKE